PTPSTSCTPPTSWRSPTRWGAGCRRRGRRSRRSFASGTGMARGECSSPSARRAWTRTARAPSSSTRGTSRSAWRRSGRCVPARSGCGRGWRALRRSEETNRALVEHATYGIYRSTPAGRFLSVNSALVRMLGYDSEDELLALDLGQQVYADPAARARALAGFSGADSVQGLEVE